MALIGHERRRGGGPGTSAWPPYSLSLAPGAGVVYVVEVLAVAAGAVASLAVSLRAANSGPGPRRLLTGGTLAAAGLTRCSRPPGAPT